MQGHTRATNPSYFFEPTTTLSFLGYKIDSIKSKVRLPLEKKKSRQAIEKKLSLAGKSPYTHYSHLLAYLILLVQSLSVVGPSLGD